MSPIPCVPIDEIAVLRARATALRRLAARVEHTDLHAVARLAGDDTWIGATAEVCREDLTIAIRGLDAAADDLRRQATLLERRADILAAPSGVRA